MAAFNFHRRRTRRWWYAGMTLMAAAAFAVFYVGGASAVTGSPSNFESHDGNMTLGASGNTDWNCFQGAGGFATLASGTPTGCAKTSGATQVSADLPTSVGEITWTKGQKFDILCPGIDTKSTPPKDDFTNVAEYQEFDGNGNLFFYGGAIRSTANGNTSGDVEFNQAAGSAASFGCRTAGDLLIAYDFLNGGTSLDFHVLTWITAAKPNLNGNSGKCLVKTDSLPCWGAVVVTPDASTFDGEANQSSIAAADNGFSGTALASQQFAEFGINLTRALGGGALPCFPQQVWESRSSGSSFTSSPEDLEFVHVSTCGALKITKMAKNHNLGTGLHPESGVTFTIANSSGFSTTVTTGNDGTVCTDSLSPGSYTVTETVPSGYAAASTNPQTVNVASGSTCSGTPSTANFTNTPLSTITLGFHSLAGTGVTAATVSCQNNVLASQSLPEGDATVTLGDGTTSLAPGSYTCTVVVDP